MIDLTPLEVRQKKGDFRRAVRGYDAELVNDFLDLVADRMEELVRQNMALTDRVESLEEDLDGYQAKERALSDGLMAAQKLREETRSQAEREGELMIREARLAAEAARREASEALAREEEMLRQVRSRRSHLVQSFRRLLEREMAELAVIEETLQLEAERDADRRGAPPARAPEPDPDAQLDLQPQAAERDRPATPAPGPDVEEAGPSSDGTADGRETGGTADGSDAAEPAGADANDDTEDWLKSLVEE